MIIKCRYFQDDILDHYKNIELLCYENIIILLFHLHLIILFNS